MGIVHIEPLRAPGRSSCSALAILRIADGNQVAAPVKALEHQFVECGWQPAEIKHHREQVPACSTDAHMVVAKSTQEEGRSDGRQWQFRKSLHEMLPAEVAQAVCEN